RRHMRRSNEIAAQAVQDNYDGAAHGLPFGSNCDWCPLCWHVEPPVACDGADIQCRATSLAVCGRYAVPSLDTNGGCPCDFRPPCGHQGATRRVTAPVKPCWD